MSRELLLKAAAGCQERGPLDLAQIPEIASRLLDPDVPEAAKKEFLRALAGKGETAEELAAFAQALLPRAVDPGFAGIWNGRLLIDCCGTGGGGLNILNVSTAIMFVLAGADVPVVKHGNRGVTKKSGSADVLEALGIRVELTPRGLRECLDTVGCAFIFAPAYHPAFKVLAPVRRDLAAEGRRTIFNLLGPLLNPCRPAAQLVGVFSAEHASLFAEALHFLGRKRYAAVCGYDETGAAIGEFSTFGKNIARGSVSFGSIIPAAPGLVKVLEVESAEGSARWIERVLTGEEKGPAWEMIRGNAAAAFYVQGRVDELVDGMRLAEETVVSGKAARVLEKWRAFDQT